MVSAVARMIILLILATSFFALNVKASQDPVACNIVVPKPPADCTLGGYFREGRKMECNRS